MALSYRQVKDLYDILHQSGATQASLPEWSQQMQAATDSDMYAAGLNDNLIKQASVGIDRALEYTGLPNLGGQFGRGFGDLVGMGDQGEQIGRGLPRMAVNLAPLALGGPLGLGLTGALSGAETYTETGSPAAGLLSGITNAALPAVAGRAEQGTLAFLRSQGIKSGIEEALLPRLVSGQNAIGWIDRFTPKAIEAVNHLFPRTFGQTAASNIGGQLAAAGLMGASDIGQDVLAGRDIRNPFTSEMGLNLTLGQLPFALLHLGGKSLGFGEKFHGVDPQTGATFTRPFTANDAADRLQNSVDYTKSMVDRQANEEALRTKGIDAIPNQDVSAFSEEQQQKHDALMASLSKQENEIKANPSLENLAKLGEVTQAKDEAIAKTVDERNPTVGISKPYAGGIPVTGENHYRKDDTGYNVITIKSVPEGATYQDGTSIQVGDRVSFSDGKYPTGVNKDGTENFQLGIGKDGKKYFSKVVDTKEVIPTAKGEMLPLQQAEFNHQQFSQNLKELDELEKSLVGIGGYADTVDALEKVNELRARIGYPEIDMVSLLREARKRKIKGNPQSVYALLAETKRNQILEQKNNQDYMDGLRKEIDLRNDLQQKAAPGTDEGIILDMYEELSKETGRRGDIASTGLFWQKALQLQEQGKLTPANLRGAINKMVESGKELKGNIQKAPEGPVFQAMSSEDKATYKLGAEAVLRATRNAPNSDEANIFKRVIAQAAGGKIVFDTEAIHDAIVSLDLAPEGHEATMFANEVLNSPLVHGWMKELSDLPKHLPPDFIEGDFKKIGELSNTPGRIEEKQPSAGGDFVWGMQNYDPVNNKLGKHTLPKSGVLSEYSLKQVGGRNGKPLQDVEIEMMKAVDKATGTGAFKDGMVDVRKLQSVLAENPVEVHVYGQQGKSTPAKEKFDELTHTWYDELPGRLRSWIERGETIEDMKKMEGDDKTAIRDIIYSPDFETKLDYYNKLGNRVREELPNGVGPKATSYYNSISLFDTKKYPVVRVDVSLPSKKVEGSKPGAFRSLDAAEREAGVLWPQDNLHENLPNTLGWAMVQFVPDSKGNTVMFVGEQQSRWGQQRTKLENDFKKGSLDPNDTRNQELVPNHPLLPFQHVLVLKAAAQEAARRGVSKMVVSDGETAMMTEMHDKNLRSIRRTRDQGNWIVNVGGEWNAFKTEAEADAFEEQAKRPSQEGGMRLHYDTTLSSAAKKLTGSEGEEVEMPGVHKNTIEQQKEGDTYATETQAREDVGEFGQVRQRGDGRWQGIPVDVKGSPVFKNADGTPKSSITGREYDLSSIQETARQQGGLTLGDPSRIGKPEPKPFTPTPEQKPIYNVLTGTGEDRVRHLLDSPDKEYQALAKDLLPFASALKASNGHIDEKYGTAATAARLDKMGSEVYFHPNVLDMNRATQDNIILHELGHELSLNLLEKGLSPELEAKLDDILNRGVKALPNKLRDQYTKAIAEDWLKKSKETAMDGKDNWDDLAPESEGFSEGDRQVLYGLINNKELISQSWSSQTFKNYLKKIPGKVNGLKSFINWTKQLFGLGDKHDNLLRELLETTHALMSHGEFLTSAEDYGRAYFDSKGVDPVYGKRQTDRGIELLENSVNGTTPGSIAGELSLTQDRANPKLNQAKARVDQVLKDPEDFNHDGIKQTLQEWGHEPTAKGIDDMVIAALDEGHDLGDALMTMPLPMARYIYEKVKDQKDIVEMLQAATAKKNKGIMNIARPELVREPLFEVGKRMDKILESEERENESAQELVGLSSIDPFGFLKSQMSHVGKVEEKPEDGKIPVDRSWLARFLEPMGQMALRFPEAQEIISKGFQLVTNGRKLAHNSLKILGANIKSEHLDVIDKDSVKEAEKIASNPVLRDGVNKWIAENQFKNKDSVSMLDESDPEIAKLKQRYTSEQWDQIRDFVMKQGMSRQKFNSDKLAFLKMISSVRGAGVISESGLKTGENIAIVDAMLKAVQAMKDPLGAEGAKAQFENIRSKIKNPEDFIALLEYSKGEAEKLDSVKEVLDKNPFWAPAQRMEQWLVTGSKNGKAWKGSYSSKKEAEIEVRNNGVKAFTIEDQWKGKEDEPFELPGMSPAMLERMREIEENQIKILVKAGVLNADGLEEYRKSSVMGQVAREADAGTGTSGLKAPPRLLSHGAEDLPWLRNHIVGIQREARYLARQLLRAQKDTYLKSPELRENDQLRTDLSTHFDNILHPDPQLAQKMTRFASTWFMGFNLASTLVNATQPFLMHVSEMTAITGRPMESYRRVTRAIKEAIAGSYGKHAWATKEHEQFMEDMAEAGERSLSMYDDEAQDHEAVATGMLRALDKQKPQTLGQKLSSAAGVYSTVAMMPFKAVEQINASAALLASFDYYREQGLGYEEAKEKAATFNRGVNYSGGRGQRPVLAYAGRGAFPRGSAMLGTALQSYVMGTTAQIGRYLQAGLFRPKGTTPYETYSARKAAAQMLGTQLAAAGLLGLPFVSGAIALLDKLFPDLELNKKIREGVSGFLHSDTENGSPLSDIAMTGVPSMLGWDLQSRLSMGNTLPGVSEVNGFQPENLIGPVANIVKNFVGGVQGWAQGDLGSTGKFLPPAVRKLIETGQSSLTDGGAIRDYQGRPLEVPSTGEKLGQAIGFQPKRLSDQNAAARILKQTTDVQNQKQREEVGQMAQEVIKGNYGTVRQAILQKIQGNKDYNPEDVVRAIAQNVEDMSLPRDLRREGDLRTSGSRSGLLSSFSNLSSSGSVSEVARLQLRQEVERKLGLNRPQAGALKVAQLMDQMKQAQPDLTRAQLRQSAQQVLRRSQPSTLQIPEE